MEKIKIQHIEPGDNLLVHSHTFIGEEIQKFEHDYYKYGWQYNHAAKFVTINGDLMVSEAVGIGIVYTNFNKYINGNYGLLCLKPKFQIKTDEMMKICNRFAGQSKYDYWNLLLYQSIRMITKNKIWIGGNKLTNKFICGVWCGYLDNHFENVFKNTKRVAPPDFFNSDMYDKYIIKP